MRQAFSNRKSKKPRKDRGTMLVFDHKKLKAERAKQGVSQGKFAEMLKEYIPKASKSLVQRWEEGAMPNGVNLVALSKVLKKRPEYFVYDVPVEGPDDVFNASEKRQIIKKAFEELKSKAKKGKKA